MKQSLGHWDPYTPNQVSDLFAVFGSPWWVAGGWALDLFLGRSTRAHDDIDVEIPRAAANRLSGHLCGWDLQLASDGRLQAWSADEAIPDRVNSLWCRPAAGDPWRLQVMLASVQDCVWHYRRDDRITRKLAVIVLQSTDGIAYLAPEIQLLYKSKDPRDKDEADFASVVPRMDGVQRNWLRDALALVSPDHPWIARLRRKTPDS